MLPCALRRDALHSAEREDALMTKTEPVTRAATDGIAVVTIANLWTGIWGRGPEALARL